MDEKDSVYLDYNATTPLEPEVLAAIQDALQQAWGNPSSRYQAGTKAKEIIAESRKHIANMIGAKPSDIIFTSGGTEANNQILRTAMKYFWKHHDSTSNDTKEERSLRPHFITSNLEHDSVQLVLEHFKQERLADVTVVPADPRCGHVMVEDVLAAITPCTCMITIMLANNETGIIQPVAEISESLRLREQSAEPGCMRVLLHTDAAQAIGKIPVDVLSLGVDYLTVVGHKFYGPRIGAIYSSDKVPLYPLLYGGGQERNIRPGTENTGMIAGLGKAAELVVQNLTTYEHHMMEIRDYLETSLTDSFGSDFVVFNGKYAKSRRIPNTCNVSFMGKGITGQSILNGCRRLQASVGAACHSGLTDRVSPILLASGVSERVARCALRLSVGRHTTKEDIDLIVEDLKQALARLDGNQP